MTKKEHLQFCKNRALEYVDINDLNNAFNSFQSDMRNHEETRNHSALELFSILMFNGVLNSQEKMRKFIEDFN